MLCSPGTKFSFDDVRRTLHGCVGIASIHCPWWPEQIILLDRILDRENGLERLVLHLDQFFRNTTLGIAFSSDEKHCLTNEGHLIFCKARFILDNRPHLIVPGDIVE